MADLAILLVSGDHPRVHAAFLVAAGAAALGRRVTIFATGPGTRALCRDWSLLDNAGNDATLRSRGVAGFDALREALIELGASFIACESGLAGEAIPLNALLPGVQRSGMASFLEATTQAQLIAL